LQRRRTYGDEFAMNSRRRSEKKEHPSQGHEDADEEWEKLLGERGTSDEDN
jgi:hypothetical protein